jgi:hypothetical protein
MSRRARCGRRSDLVLKTQPCANRSVLPRAETSISPDGVTNQTLPVFPDRPPMPGSVMVITFVQADELSLNVPATTGSGAIGDNRRHRQSIAARSAQRRSA